MKHPLHFFAVILPAVSLFFCGCAVSGKITDFNKKSTFVSSIYLEEPGTLKIHDGQALRQVRLTKVKLLRISADVTKIINRELYYLAEIQFKDGEIAGSMDDKRVKAYVSVNYRLFGLAQGNDYSIMLNDVTKIEFGIR